MVDTLNSDLNNNSLFYVGPVSEHHIRLAHASDQIITARQLGDRREYPCLIKSEVVLDWGKNSHAFSLRPLAFHFGTKLTEHGDVPICYLKFLEGPLDSRRPDGGKARILNFQQALFELATTAMAPIQGELQKGLTRVNSYLLNDNLYAVRDYIRVFNEETLSHSSKTARRPFVLAEQGPCINLDYFSDKNSVTTLYAIAFLESKPRQPQYGFLLRKVIDVAGDKIYDERVLKVAQAVPLLQTLYNSKVGT